jgi:hypothetical protein
MTFFFLHSAARLFADQDYGGQVARDDELVMVVGATDDPAYHQNFLVNGDSDEEDLLKYETLLFVSTQTIFSFLEILIKIF